VGAFSKRDLVAWRVNPVLSGQGSPCVDPMPVQEDAWMGSVVRNVRMILEDIQTVRFASSVFLFLGCIQLSAKGFNLSFQEN
jgi:hypothetical protein